MNTRPDPRAYDTPDDWDDAMQAYICYMEIERQKEDERIENEDKTE